MTRYWLASAVALVMMSGAVLAQGAEPPGSGALPVTATPSGLRAAGLGNKTAAQGRPDLLAGWMKEGYVTPENAGRYREELAAMGKTPGTDDYDTAAGILAFPSKSGSK